MSKLLVLVAAFLFTLGCGGSSPAPTLFSSAREDADAADDGGGEAGDDAAPEASVVVDAGSTPEAASDSATCTPATSCAGAGFTCGDWIDPCAGTLFGCGQCAPGWTCVLSPGGTGVDKPGTCQSFCGAGQHQCSDGGCSNDPC